MATPKISVIVPVHNTKEYLVQCLDTIINQTFQDVEIICVDDGSTDGSSCILERFAAEDNRITIITLESASGSAAVPRNIGLELACGKYVIFLDSDDYFDLNMLHKLYTHADETKADLVICDNYTVSFNTNEINSNDSYLHSNYLPKKKVFSYKDIPDTIFQITNATAWNKLMLRETLIKHNLRFQPIRILNDLYLVNLLMVLSERISVLQEKLIFYRKYRTGGLSSNIEDNADSIFKAYLELNNYLIKHSVYETVKQSLQNWTLTSLAWWLRSVGNYNIYSQLCEMFKNEYFISLNLVDMDTDDIYDEEVKRFYHGILGCDAEHSLRDVLELILKSESKIALYGAGWVGYNTYKLIKTQGKHNIVIWCDANADKLARILENPLIKPPEELISSEFDAVVIAILDNSTINCVKNNLLDMGIKSEKIYTV